MTADIIIMCTKDSSELALELGLVYAMMQTPIHLIGSVNATESPHLDFFRELGGQVHDTDLSTLLRLHPTSQLIRL
jgi:hypothetical protein